MSWLNDSWVWIHAWPAWWKFADLAFSALVVAFTYFWFTKHRVGNEAQNTAAIWGVISFALLLFFYLGASSSTKQFLVLFSNGVLGAALGYLVGVWLAPASADEESRFDKARSLVGTLLAGVVGTKLLSLWDTLTKSDSPLIFNPDYYLPFASTLVGFFVSLAAFYTLRGADHGDVRVTAPKDKFLKYASGNDVRENGLRESAEVQFSGAADCDDDVSVTWEIHPSTTKFDIIRGDEWLSATGLLKVPPKDKLEQLVKDHGPEALNWTIVARSNRDRGQTFTFPVRFCRGDEDCPPPPAGAAGAAAPPKPKAQNKGVDGPKEVRDESSTGIGGNA